MELRLRSEMVLRFGCRALSIPKSSMLKYLCSTLRLDTRKENRVQFEIVGVDEEDWKHISERLLFIGEYPESIKVIGGHVLTSPKYKGKIFVKGILL